jgi:hypothetical protein
MINTPQGSVFVSLFYSLVRTGASIFLKKVSQGKSLKRPGSAARSESDDNNRENHRTLLAETAVQSISGASIP